MLKWENVSIRVRNRNLQAKEKYFDIVKNNNGCLEKGQIVAIMGPSGGGKTTLINALSGRVPKGAITQGNITYNGVPRNKKTWFKNVGFVDQDDVIHENLTVKETLRYSALFRLKLDGAGDKKKKLPNNSDIESILEEVISDLNLQKCADNLMKFVSGGERKRAMIGIELVTNPDFLFLDEPTSGLDTFTALKIVKILKKLSVEKEKSVLITIHQPSIEIFHIFDKVILLNKGCVVYDGATTIVEEYFKQFGILKRSLISVPEFIVEICSDDYRNDNQSQLYDESSVFKETPILQNKLIEKQNNDFYCDLTINFKHIMLLISRKLRTDYNNKSAVIKLFLYKFFLVAFFLFTFLQISTIIDRKLLEAIIGENLYNQISSFLDKLSDDSKTILAIVRGFKIMILFPFVIISLEMQNTITCFYSESAIVKREIAVGTYSTISYYFSIYIFQFLKETICPLIMILIVKIIMPNYLNMQLAGILLCYIFITVPLGLFIASFSTSLPIITILSNIFPVIASLSPSYLSSIVLSCLSNKSLDNHVFVFLSNLLVLMPTIHLSAILQYNSFYVDTSNYSKEDTDTNNVIMEIFTKDILKFIGGRKLTIFQLKILCLVTTILYILLGIGLLLWRQVPEFRLKIQKKIKKK